MFSYSRTITLNFQYVFRGTLAAFIVVSGSFQTNRTFAHQPFTDVDVNVAAQQQNWEQRRRFMADTNDRLGKDLRGREEFVLGLAEGQARDTPGDVLARRFFGGPTMAFPTGIGPIGSTGDRNILTVMIEFPDTPGDIDRDKIENAILSDGGPSAKLPFDSVRNYYQRASQGKLNIGGDVVGWVQMDKDRGEYGANPNNLKQHQLALLEMFSEALGKIDATTDFSQYDNDNDGDIDGLVVLYAGKPEGWGDFFWAYRWTFFIPEANDVKFDGKSLEQFVFQFVEKRPNGDYDAKVLVHEMGHLLGLNDYYDYCPTHRFNANQCSPTITDPGPDGGTGRFDMMDGNWGNHNAYSRWLMDWISPQVIGAGEHMIELRPSGLGTPRADRNDPQDAVAVFPVLDAASDGSAPAREMFLVEYRKNVGNDSLIPIKEGIVIWHLAATQSDAPLNSVFDNSYTTPKQLRFVRSGSVSDFSFSGEAQAADFFISGDVFGPSTTPASASHDGGPTGVKITVIEFDGDVARLKIEVNPLFFTATDATTPADTTSFSSQPGMPSEPDQDGLLDRLIQLERDYTDLSSDELEQVWQRYATAPAGNLSPEEIIRARMALVKWSQKDGIAALSAYTSANKPLQSALSDVVDDALDAFVTSRPLIAGDAFLDPTQTDFRSLVSQAGSLDFVRKAFEARAQFDEKSVAEDLSRLQGVEATFSAINGLRAGGVTIEALDEISGIFAGERATLDAVIGLERSIQEFEAQSDSSVPPNLSNEVMRSILEKFDLQNSMQQ